MIGRLPDAARSATVVAVGGARRPSPPMPPAGPLPTPRPSRLAGGDVVGALVALALLVLGTWWRHGGMVELAQGWTPLASSLTRLSGLTASAVGLVGLVLVARPRSLERRYGLDRMLVWHRYLGETMAVLVAAHVVAGLVAWSATGGVSGAIVDLTGRQPWMAAATVGALLVGVVTVSSLRSVRRRMSYETWYFVHLTAYLGLALAMGHELVLGTDLSSDTVARTVWIALHAAVLGLLVVSRWGRVLRSVARPLRLAQVVRHGDDVVEWRLAGSGLAHVEADAGQFVVLRPLVRGLWWQAHPFSLSGAPGTDGLRVTIKARGDATAAMQRLRPGTRIAVEGPYGVGTPDALGPGPALFVIGGVGVAPARSLIERLGDESRPVVLYRARRREDLVHLDDLRRLTAERGGRVHTLVGRTSELRGCDPYSASALTNAVPDLADRVAVVCGPERLVHAARAGLVVAGVPRHRVHLEHVWW